MTLAHVHFLQHLHGNEGVLNVNGEEVSVSDEGLVQVSPILHVAAELFLRDHVILGHRLVLSTIIIKNYYPIVEMFEHRLDGLCMLDMLLPNQDIARL